MCPEELISTARRKVYHDLLSSASAMSQLRTYAELVASSLRMTKLRVMLRAYLSARKGIWGGEMYGGKRATRASLMAIL